jgi:hypothetical protein
VIFAGTRGYLDDISVDDVGSFEAGLLDWFRTRHAGVLESIKNTGKIEDEDAFDAAIKAYAAQFQGTSVAGSAPAASAAGDADSTIATSSRHLPEEDVVRDDAGVTDSGTLPEGEQTV